MCPAEYALLTSMVLTTKTISLSLIWQLVASPDPLRYALIVSATGQSSATDLAFSDTTPDSGNNNILCGASYPVFNYPNCGDVIRKGIYARKNAGNTVNGTFYLLSLNPELEAQYRAIGLKTLFK